MKGKQGRTVPKIAGSPIYRHGDLVPSPGNSVYKHQQKYHVFVGLSKVLETTDLEAAFAAATRPSSP